MRLTAQARAEKHYPHRGEPRVDCPTCGAKYTFYTVSLTGVAWQACRCEDRPVPVKRLDSTVVHDQHERQVQDLARAVASSLRPAVGDGRFHGPGIRMGPKHRPPDHPWKNRP